MAITSRKINAYSKTHAMLSDVPSPAYTAAQLKDWYDTAPEEVRVALNGLIDDLGSTTPGSSGAEQIGSANITGVAGNTVYQQIADVKAQITNAALGTIPDGTVTPAKLSFDPTTQAELDAHAGTTRHTPFAATTGTANAYAVTLSPAPASYVDGFAVAVKINVDSTATSTLNVNGLGVKALKKANGNDVTNLKANGVYTFRYNATTGNFILQGDGGNGTAQPSEVLATKTFSNDLGDQVGTMPDRGTTANQSLTTQNQSYTVNAGYHRQTFSVTATYVAGKRIATGSGTCDASGNVAVSGIPFTPGTVIVEATAPGNTFYRKVHTGLFADSRTPQLNQTTYWTFGTIGAQSISAFTVGASNFSGSFHANLANVAFTWAVIEA